MQDESAAAIAERTARMTLSRAKYIQLPEVMVCSPHGTDEEGMRYRILVLETDLKAVATADDGYKLVVGLLDKASQNPINQLGGFTGAGDAAMAAYWDTVRRAVGGLAHVSGSEFVELIRMNSGSDEGVFTMGGRQLTRHAEVEFGVAWEQARNSINLSEYRYSIRVPTTSGTKAYNLDLEAFSSVLRHPAMVLSCHYSISQPKGIDRNAEGFIMDTVRQMENKEISAFYNNLPWSFKRGNGGLAEVDTPFETNLTKLGITGRSHGTFVEIKLNAPESRELLRFVKDHDGVTGTRKGHAEVYSHNLGMRGFNTFLGKARANSILTPISWAMDDIGRQPATDGKKRVTVLPLNDGCYLEYWLDLPPNEATRQRIKDAVDGRIHSERGGPGYVNLGFTPVISMLDASGVAVNDVKQMFILRSLGREAHSAAILERTDFLINFLQNINKSIQDDIFSKLRISGEDNERIASIRFLCSQKRTLRNTEDTVWTIRADEELPPNIKRVRQELEDWLFRFATEKYESVFRLLADRIRERMSSRK